MGLLEKIKNMFTEEVEDDDVKVERIKQEVTKVSIETPKVNKFVEDEKKDDFKLNVEEVHSKPVFFDDNDFKDLNLERNSKKNDDVLKEQKMYKIDSEKEKKQLEKPKKIFKPTPIISPVYGVLDKNYHKEDIVSKKTKETKLGAYESSIDIVRNKAYGTLEDELENTLFGTNSILFKKDEINDNEINEVDEDVLTDLTDDISKELDEILLKKDKYLEKKEESPSDSSINDDLLDFIDSTLYKEGEE